MPGRRKTTLKLRVQRNHGARPPSHQHTPCLPPCARPRNASIPAARKQKGGGWHGPYLFNRAEVGKAAEEERGEVRLQVRAERHVLQREEVAQHDRHLYASPRCALRAVRRRRASATH